jgi:hypothetical protein
MMLDQFLSEGEKKTVEPTGLVIPENEDENPEEALRDALDAHGDFHTMDSGVLIWNDFLQVHKIICR